MGSNRVILLVDPDPSRRAAIADRLKGSTFHIEPFEGSGELISRWPKGNILLVWDEANAIKELQDLVINSGRDVWIIGYAAQVDTTRVVNSILYGALDYLIWPFNDADLQSSINRTKKADGIFGRARRRQAEARMRVQALTPRERDVLQLVGFGLSAREIGESMGISSRTVEVHRQNIAKKIGGSGTWDMIRLAVDVGLIETVDTQGKEHNSISV